jgi:Kef-type K+ transport system membrane component KefB
MTEQIFIDISIILSIAIGVAFLVQMFKQPLIISYIITGIICGPLFLNLVNSGLEFYDLFAELGVILLLFLVGLSLNIDYLRKIGKVAVITGVGQVLFTVFFGFFLILLLGFSKLAAVYLAISITFSSTIIIMKLLSDKKALRTVYGRYTIGLMLVQDIIAIALIIVLPSLSEGAVLPALGLLLVKFMALLGAVYVLAKVMLPVILSRAARSGEFLMIFTIAWCFAIAGLGKLAGISLEVGAIIAGLSLGSSIYREEIGSRIKPIRDFFIALFFIILGSEMNLSNLRDAILPGMAISAFVLLGNPFILYILYRRLKFTRRNSFLASLTAAQVSEFGFVFLYLAGGLGYIGGEVMSVFTIVALSTIFVSSYLITYSEKVFSFIHPVFKLFGPDKNEAQEEADDKYDFLVLGYHRLGWKICELLKEKEVNFAVVDNDPGAIEKLRIRNVPCFYGDVSDVEFLSELPLDEVKMIISTLPEAEDQITFIKHLRGAGNDAIIIANLAHSKFLDEMYEAGADYIMMPHLISGEWMAGILRKHKWDKRTFNRLCRLQKEEMRLRYNLGHH